MLHYAMVHHIASTLTECALSDKIGENVKYRRSLEVTRVFAQHHYQGRDVNIQ